MDSSTAMGLTSLQEAYAQEKEHTTYQLPVYQVPRVISYTDEDILEQLGPAQTGGGSLGGGTGHWV